MSDVLIPSGPTICQCGKPRRLHPGGGPTRGGSCTGFTEVRPARVVSRARRPLPSTRPAPTDPFAVSSVPAPRTTSVPAGQIPAGRVDAQRAITKLADLQREWGMSVSGIARATGLPVKLIQRLLGPENPREGSAAQRAQGTILPGQEAAILGLDPKKITDEKISVRRDAKPLRDLIRTLRPEGVRCGDQVSRNNIAARAKVSPWTIREIDTGRLKGVPLPEWNQIERACKELIGEMEVGRD